MNPFSQRPVLRDLSEATILVTGGAGFVGSHLLERLQESHPRARLLCLDNYFTGVEENHIENVLYIKGDTKDIDSLITDKIDIVFHLGEYARVEKSFDEPDIVFEMNIKGTLAVVMFCIKQKAKLVYAASSTKFADKNTGKQQSPYAWSKATNVELINNYGAWYGLEYAITYFYNVYGGRERGEGQYATLIGIFTHKYKNNESLPVVAPGTQKRNFTHVSDIVNGLVLAAKHGQGDGYELGADERFSVLDVANMFQANVVILPERKGNRMGGIIDSTKSRKELGWEPQVALVQHIGSITGNVEVKFHLISLFVGAPDNKKIEFFRYVVMGCIAFAVDFLIMYFLTEKMHVPYLESNIFSSIAGITTNYIIGTAWVFRSRRVERRLSEILAVFAISLGGLGVTQFFLWFLTEFFFVHYLISKVIASIIALVFNFTARKIVVY